MTSQLSTLSSGVVLAVESALSWTALEFSSFAPISLFSAGIGTSLPAWSPHSPLLIFQTTIWNALGLVEIYFALLLSFVLSVRQTAPLRGGSHRYLEQRSCSCNCSYHCSCSCRCSCSCSSTVSASAPPRPRNLKQVHTRYKHGQQGVAANCFVNTNKTEGNNDCWYRRQDIRKYTFYRTNLCTQIYVHNRIGFTTMFNLAAHRTVEPQRLATWNWIAFLSVVI